MEILDVKWFGGTGTGVGIVRLNDADKGIQYRIGAKTGYLSEEIDAWSIADYGDSFPNKAGDILFGVE